MSRLTVEPRVDESARRRSRRGGAWGEPGLSGKRATSTRALFALFLDCRRRRKMQRVGGESEGDLQGARPLRELRRPRMALHVMDYHPPRTPLARSRE